MATWGKRAELTETVLSLADRFSRIGGLVGGTAVASIVTGWAAAVTEALDQYSPLSWVLASLLGALLFMIILWALATIRVRLAERRILQRHELTPPPFNPLDDTFNRQQIDIRHFQKPLPRSNDKKSFIGCELLGPAVVFFGNNSAVVDNTVFDCDFVVVKPGATVSNMIIFNDATVRNCTLCNLTILVPPSLAHQIESNSPGGNWITETPNVEG